MKNTIEKVKSVLGTFKERKKNILASIIAFLLFGLLFFESGFAAYSFISSRAKILILVAIFALIISLLCLLFDYQLLFSKINKFLESFKIDKKSTLIKFVKKIPVEVYVYFFLCIFLLLSFIFNNSKTSNLNGYLMLFSLMLISIFLSKLFSLVEYAKAFSKIMLAICIISCLINLFYLISGEDLANSIHSTQTGSSRITSFFYLFIFNISNNAYRMSGPFWEPGVFASMSLIAMLLYHFYVNKKNYFIPFIFSIGIIFTQSAAGLLLLCLVWLILVFDVLKSKKASNVLGFFTILIFFLIAMAILIPPLLDILTKLFPSVFTKFRTVSFFSRFYSLTYGFKIFARSPLFGVGPVTARELFFELTKSDGITVDAFTSTLGTLAASYGFIGILIYLFPIVGLIYNKKLSFYQKVLLALFYFLTTLQESQVEIFMISIFYLIFGIFGLTELIKKCHHKQIFCLDDNKKCLLNLFFCKNEKGNVTLNIAINIVVKFLALLIGFITISIYSDYFGNKNAYGIWLSMISISTWILQLDFGFGNSLRNKLTEARVKNDKAKEQSIISSTYAVTFLMTVIWIIISLILCNVLDLFSIFKASEEYVSSSVLKASVLIVLISIAVELSLRNITYILQVIGKSGIASSLTLISNILVLVFVSVARIEGEEKFIVLSLVYSIAILLPLLIASLIVFLKKKVPFINLKTINKESIRSVSKLGIGFFVVQLSNLFLWSLNDVLLINLLNKPDVVVDYTEYYKLFSAITGLAMVLQGPVWVGISSAKEKGDITKFKKYCKINLVFCVFLAVCSAILTLCLPVVFHIWLGDNTPSISIVYQVIMLMFAFVTCGYQYFGLICNGLGSVKAQVVVACIAVALKVPLTLLFNTFFGNTLQWSSVILSNTILISIYLFVLPISIKREVKKMKKNRSFESL